MSRDFFKKQGKNKVILLDNSIIMYYYISVKYFCLTVCQSGGAVMQVKELKTSLLIEIYRSMLTDKQYEVMDMYFNLDYSLTEIAENEGISRQGVLDIIKRSEQKLGEYEQKLGLMKKYEITEAALLKIEQLTKDSTVKRDIFGAIASIRSVWEE